MHRVLASNGTVALSSWTQADERWAWEATLLRDLAVDRRPSSRPFDKAEDLEELLSGAGFDRARTTVERYDITFADEDEWWEWKWSYRVRGVLEQADDTARNTFREAAVAAMQPFRGAQGFPMSLAALFAIADKT
jgi:hypothetical protein